MVSGSARTSTGNRIIENVAEGVMNGILCHYEPPENPPPSNRQLRHRSILRQTTSKIHAGNVTDDEHDDDDETNSMNESTGGGSVIRNSMSSGNRVRWNLRDDIHSKHSRNDDTDDTDDDDSIVDKYDTNRRKSSSRSSSHSKGSSSTRKSSTSSSSRRRHSSDSGSGSRSQQKLKQQQPQSKVDPPTSRYSNIARTCLDASIELGCRSGGSHLESSSQPMRKEMDAAEAIAVAKARSPKSDHTNGDAARLVFDDEGNPAYAPSKQTSRKGSKALLPLPPPPPPPSRNERFFPQLCGVHINCGGGNDEAMLLQATASNSFDYSDAAATRNSSKKRSTARSKGADEDDEFNSMMDGGGGVAAATDTDWTKSPPPQSNDTASDSETNTAKTSTLQQQRSKQRNDTKKKASTTRRSRKESRRSRSRSPSSRYRSRKHTSVMDMSDDDADGIIQQMTDIEESDTDDAIELVRNESTINASAKKLNGLSFFKKSTKPSTPRKASPRMKIQSNNMDWDNSVPIVPISPHHQKNVPEEPTPKSHRRRNSVFSSSSMLLRSRSVEREKANRRNRHSLDSCGSIRSYEVKEKRKLPPSNRRQSSGTQYHPAHPLSQQKSPKMSHDEAAERQSFITEYRRGMDGVKKPDVDLDRQSYSTLSRGDDNGPPPPPPNARKMSRQDSQITRNRQDDHPAAAASTTIKSELGRETTTTTNDKSWNVGFLPPPPSGNQQQQQQPHQFLPPPGMYYQNQIGSSQPLQQQQQQHQQQMMQPQLPPTYPYQYQQQQQQLLPIQQYYQTGGFPSSQNIAVLLPPPAAAAISSTISEKRDDNNAVKENPVAEVTWEERTRQAWERLRGGVEYALALEDKSKKSEIETSLSPKQTEGVAKDVVPGSYDIMQQHRQVHTISGLSPGPQQVMTNDHHRRGNNMVDSGVHINYNNTPAHNGQIDYQSENNIPQILPTNTNNKKKKKKLRGTKLISAMFGKNKKQHEKGIGERNGTFTTGSSSSVPSMTSSISSNVKKYNHGSNVTSDPYQINVAREMATNQAILKEASLETNVPPHLQAVYDQQAGIAAQQQQHPYSYNSGSSNMSQRYVLDQNGNGRLIYM